MSRTMVTNLTISDAVMISLSKSEGKLSVLKESDHLLRRFGQVDVLFVEDGGMISVHREAADEIWSVISGSAVFELEDRRDGSPTEGETDLIKMSDEAPRALLIPFGVAFQIASENQGVLIRISTHEDTIYKNDLIV